MGDHADLLDVRPGHPEDETDPRVVKLIAVLSELPSAEQDAVQSRLAAVVVNYERTGQLDPLIHFVESLLMTVRLRRNAAYRRELAKADEAALAGEPTDTGEIHDFMVALRERRAD